MCDKNFIRTDNLYTYLRKIHDQNNIVKSKTKRQPWKDIDSEKPVKFIPPFEARLRTCSIRRKHDFSYDDIESKYAKEPILNNCSIGIIPETLRPPKDLPPKPTQEGLFPPIATKATINNGAAKIWIRRTKLIKKKRPYCTSDFYHRTRFTTKLKRWSTLNEKTIRENTEKITQQMDKK